MIITVDDVKKAGYCTKGMRKWMTGLGLDIQDFVTNGIDTDDLSEVSDARLQRVIEIAKKRDTKNGII